MNESKMDLRVLSRNESAPSSIPPPSRKWGIRVGLPLTITILFAALFVYAARDYLRPATAVQVVPVIVKTGGDVGGAVSFQAPGWVEPDPYFIAASALADGVVKEVLVLEGDRVEKDQVVVRMVDDDARLALTRRDNEVRIRNASVSRMEAQVKAAQREWDNPIERTRKVAVAEAQLAETQADLIKLKSDIQVETARLEELKEKLRREENLGTDVISEFDVVKTRLSGQTQKAILDTVKAQEPRIKARITRLEAEVHAAKENLRLRIQETRVLEEAKEALEQAKASLAESEGARDEAKLRLERMEVRAPEAGIVMERRTQPGAKLMLAMDSPHSAHALHLYDPKKLQVRVDVPLADAAQVSLEQKAEIVVDVLPDRTFHGQVTRVMHAADIQKNTLQVKVAIKDPSSELKPEMAARIKFIADQRKEKPGEVSSRVFIKENLITKDETGQSMVWIAGQGGTRAEKQYVTVGKTRLNDWILIEKGLQPGDRVISGNTRKLKHGSRVKITEESR